MVTCQGQIIPLNLIIGEHHQSGEQNRTKQNNDKRQYCTSERVREGSSYMVALQYLEDRTFCSCDENEIMIYS